MTLRRASPILIAAVAGILSGCLGKLEVPVVVIMTDDSDTLESNLNHNIGEEEVGTFFDISWNTGGVPAKLTHPGVAGYNNIIRTDANALLTVSSKVTLYVRKTGGTDAVITVERFLSDDGSTGWAPDTRWNPEPVTVSSSALAPYEFGDYPYMMPKNKYFLFRYKSSAPAELDGSSGNPDHRLDILTTYE